MIKTEARKILKKHSELQRISYHRLSPYQLTLGEAIDELVKYPEIAADIRDAAIYWKGYTGYGLDFTQNGIVESFNRPYEYFGPRGGDGVYKYGSEEHLTFMLFVAEALAS